MPRISPHPVPGRASVSQQAITDIIRAAVLGSYGVTGFADPSFGARVERWLRVREPGIRLEFRGTLRLDLFLTIAYGLPVAEVARQVESAVRYAVRRATDREFAELTIHVDGLRVQPGGPPPATPGSSPSPSSSSDARRASSGLAAAASSSTRGRPHGSGPKPERSPSAGHNGSRPGASGRPQGGTSPERSI
jgi:uncharacterized alkaline shock family protein YloU